MSSFQHRRFRNFKALHNSLAWEYPTYVLPSLSEDIEFRQSNLELYISKLLSHQGFMKGSVLYLPHVLKRFLSTDPDVS